MKTDSASFCKRFGDIVFNNKSSMLVNRILLIGDDVDIRDFKNIIWAFVTRCRPGKDEYLFENVPSFPLTPYMSHGRRNPLQGGKVISDCLFPMEYDNGRAFREVTFESSYPENIKNTVRSRWTEMGFAKTP